MKRILIALSLIGATLSLTACGGGDDNSPGVTYTPVPTATPTPIPTSSPTPSPTPTATPTPTPAPVADSFTQQVQGVIAGSTSTTGTPIAVSGTASSSETTQPVPLQ